MFLFLSAVGPERQTEVFMILIFPFNDHGSQCGLVLKSKDFETTQIHLRFSSWVTRLSLTFLICKMGPMIASRFVVTGGGVDRSSAWHSASAP